MRILRVAILMCFMSYSSISLATGHCTEGARCSLAIFPHSNFKQLLITYKSILEDLTLVLDTDVKLVSSRSMETFASKLSEKKYDIALVGPGQYISHAEKNGYVLLARYSGSLSMRLFVKEDSDIQSYNDLLGRKIGYMLQGTTTWYAANILLKENGIVKDSVELLTQGSQQACAHSMAINKVEACFFAEVNLGVIQQQNVNFKFRPIGKAIEIITPVFAAHPDMPKNIVTDIKEYFLSRINYVAVKEDDFDEFRQQVLSASQ